ncbi:basic amino acid ABC transporter substrate-binding protein [Candidatus Gottesmanbacteria bacterium]|nr:basic amino acid ABC transporter substrate-binding protein [Candidatus Gottesmanbacteria bacterium]
MNKLWIIIGGATLVGVLVSVIFYLNRPGGSKNTPSSEKRTPLVIAVDPTYPPMENLDEKGEFVGFDIDLGKAIGRKLGRPVTFMKVLWDDLLPKVEKGEADIGMSAITITPERAKTVLFSIPYFNSGESIVVSRSNTAVLSPEQLKGKKIAAQKNTTSENEALKITAKENIFLYQGEYAEAVSNIERGSVDALIIDYPAGIYLARLNPKMKVIGRPITSEFYGIATRIGNDELMSRINAAIGDLKSSGEYAKIENTWLSQ